MFEKLRRRLHQLQENGLKIPFEIDEKGYIDKECPVKDCLYLFKVNADDWREKFSDDAVFCPMCGHSNKSNTFWTTEQLEDAKRQVQRIIVAEMRAALKSDFESWSRTFNKNSGFIKLKIKSQGLEPIPIIVPIEAEEAFQQELVCSKCGSRYSIIGSAFFCPCCGYNCVNQTFDNSLKKIEAKVNSISKIKALLDAENRDESEVICRSIRESCLNDCVVAFQRFCEESYRTIASPGEVIKFNAFQNLETGSTYWRSKFGEAYVDWLGEADYSRMKIFFNRRHLLSHTEGIVDNSYLAKTDDTDYQIGQRIIVKDSHITDLLAYISKTVRVIRTNLDLYAREE